MRKPAPTPHLNVFRTFTNGKRVCAGELAQNHQGVFFRYAPEYLTDHPSLSPFDPPEDTALHGAGKDPHDGLYGVFADSIPDGWGRELMDIVCINQDISWLCLSQMNRLAYVGDRGMGALSYAPSVQLTSNELGNRNSISRLGIVAQAIDERWLKEVLDGAPDISTASDSQSTSNLFLKLFSSVGYACGTRPKAQLFLPDDNSGRCSITPAPGMKPYLVKFTSNNFRLRYEESLCEAAYLTLAGLANIETPNWQLLSETTKSGIRHWLAQNRFDRHPAGPGDDSHSGRLHFISACGLLDADSRAPALDYEDLIKAAGILCRGAAASQAIFRRAAFNLFACNQDDHSRNWGFLQDDDGDWRPAPFYDVTYSPHPRGEHATAYAGHGRQPPLAAMQALAAHAGFASWARAREVLEETADAVARWPAIAQELEIRLETRRLIGKSLQHAYRENRRLLTPGP